MLLFPETRKKKVFGEPSKTPCTVSGGSKHVFSPCIRTQCTGWLAGELADMLAGLAKLVGFGLGLEWDCWAVGTSGFDKNNKREQQEQKELEVTPEQGEKENKRIK